jgi:hypothetical protein
VSGALRAFPPEHSERMLARRIAVMFLKSNRDLIQSGSGGTGQEQCTCYQGAGCQPALLGSIGEKRHTADANPSGYLIPVPCK